MLHLDEYDYPYMQPAAWRWIEAQRYLANPTLLCTSLSKDSLLLEAAKFLRSSRKASSGSAYYKNKFPVLFEAFQIYSRARPGGYRWFMEAALSANDATDEMIAEELPLTHGPETVEAYRRLFFDIDSYRAKEWCVQANLLATSRLAIHDTNDYDFSWKLIAYVHGFETFKSFTRLGDPLTPKIEKWMRDIIKKRFTVHTFHITSSMRLAYNQEVFNILEMARKYYEISDETANTIKGQVPSEDIHALLKSIHFTVMHSEMKPMAVESRLYGDYNVFGAQQSQQN